MKELRETLSCLYELDESDLLTQFVRFGGTPDIVLAGLLRIFDDYPDVQLLYDSAEEAIDRVFSLVAEASEEDPEEVKKLLYRAAARRAHKMQDELYADFDGENPFQCDESMVEPRPTWSWPVVSEQEGVKPLVGDFAPFSALKMFGYTVGKTHGWDKKKRESFLSDFMEQDLPEEVEATFGGDYGQPMTATRLRKVANVIASNCGLRIKHNPRMYAHAIADWNSDLKYLKERYYNGKELMFSPWPEP